MVPNYRIMDLLLSSCRDGKLCSLTGDLENEHKGRTRVKRFGEMARWYFMVTHGMEAGQEVGEASRVPITQGTFVATDHLILSKHIEK